MEPNNNNNNVVHGPFTQYNSKGEIHVACRSRPKRILLLVPNENDLSPTYNRLIIVAPPPFSVHVEKERGGRGVANIAISFTANRASQGAPNKGAFVCVSQLILCRHPNPSTPLLAIQSKTGSLFGTRMFYPRTHVCWGGGGEKLASDYANQI